MRKEEGRVEVTEGDRYAGTVEVSNYIPTPGVRGRQARNAPKFQISPRVVGLMGALLVHAVAIYLTFSVPQHESSRPKDTKSIRTLVKPNGETEALTLLDSPSAAQDGAAVSLSLPTLMVLINLPNNMYPTIVLAADRTAEALQSNDSGEHVARLQGIYTGQIQARILRIWKRPRSPVSDDSSNSKVAPTDETFSCNVQILQDDSHNIEEILLPTCNGSSDWKRSLVVAIQQAVPLPAPPDASVFSRAITLHFDGVPFAPGAIEDEYEAPPRKISVND